MSKATSGTENGIATTDGDAPRAVEPGRFSRAVGEDMTCERAADRLYQVHSSSGSTYTVDLATGACECPDAENRGSRVYCKHAIRAGLVEIYVGARETGSPGVASALGAMVASYAREGEHGCPAGNDRLCDGPLGPRLPCPTCMDGVRSEGVDEYNVWELVVAEDR